MRTPVSRLQLAAATTAVALGAWASPALAGTYTLNMTAPATAVVGQPVVLQANGSNPPDDFFSSWLDIDALPTTAVSSCPAGYLNASQLANTTGGDQIAVAQREDVDSGGNFTMPLGWTPSSPGRFLICGYTNDGASATLAMASLAMDVQPATKQAPAEQPAPPPATAGPAAPAAPFNQERPRVTRAGRMLTCRVGRWANAPTDFSFGWVVNGRTKRGAAHRRLRITHALRHASVQCRVTASNGAGLARALSRVVRVR